MEKVVLVSHLTYISVLSHVHAQVIANSKLVLQKQGGAATFHFSFADDYFSI